MNRPPRSPSDLALSRVVLTLAVIAAFTVSACGHAPAPPPAPAVVVALPVHPDPGSDGSEPIRYPAEVAARYTTTMSFRVPGKIIERTVRLGDRVQLGQIMARLDPVDAQKQALSAQAALDAAEHRLKFAKQQLDRDLAQSEQNLIASNQLEQTQDAFTAALAARDQAAAQQVVTRNSLQYNTLVADHDGLITSENADTGQVVAAGQAVYGLAWAGDTDVIIDAAERDLGRMAPGQAASVTFPALPGRRYEAQVREIGPAADPQSRTYRVKLTLREPAQAVRLGMTGEATLHRLAAADGSQQPGADFTVPATAIFHKDNTPAVWVVVPDSSTLQLRPVTVGSYSERTVGVSAGLRDGEVVVLAGAHTVYSGQHVRTVAPLFNGEGDIEGPAVAGSAAPAAGRQ